jgi:hypothetical protein
MEHKHDKHTDSANSLPKEYFKFLTILFSILFMSLVISYFSDLPFLDSFMGVFFIVFASFKIAQLKEFAYGFQSYDLIARKSLLYSYLYPFIQLLFGILYLANQGSLWLDISVLVVSLVSGAGVLNSLMKKQVVHCVCLGNVIKLPLSKISFVEDFGMGLMAFVMIVMR